MAFSSLRASARRLTTYTRLCSSRPALAAPRPALAPSRRFSSDTPYAYILAERQADSHVGIVTLNRPKALNALSQGLLAELIAELESMQGDARVRCIVLTGSGQKAFCAGADIVEMQGNSYMDAFHADLFSVADRIARNVRKPLVAAVNGFALGGGCELAMACDIVIASDRARFGQPEIKLGTIPGIGGSQRLTRAVGKSRAMELCLTGDMISAQQASEWGLVSRAVPHESVFEEAMAVARKVAGKSAPIVSICKESVNRSYESSLAEGLLFERRLFHSTFATKDQKEGMAAFQEKREPNWAHE